MELDLAGIITAGGAAAAAILRAVTVLVRALRERRTSCTGCEHCSSGQAFELAG